MIAAFVNLEALIKDNRLSLNETVTNERKLQHDGKSESLVSVRTYVRARIATCASLLCSVLTGTFGEDRKNILFLSIFI